MLLLLFLTPLIVWNGNRTAIEIKDFVAELGILFIFLMTAMAYITKAELRFSVSLPTIAAILYAGILSLSFLRTPQSSMNLKGVMPQLLGVGCFLCVAILFRQRDVKSIIQVCVACATLTAIYGIVQHLQLDPINWKIKPLMLSFFGNQNYFTMFLVILIPLCLYPVFASNHFETQIAFGIAGIIMVTSLALSTSRASSNSFLLSGIVSGGLCLLIPKGMRFRAMGPGIIALVLILFVAVKVFSSPEAEKGRIVRGVSVEANRERAAFYLAAGEVISRYPFYGVGPGGFAGAHKENQTHIGFNKSNPNEVLNHVHNDLLETWAEHGVFGFAAFGFVLILFYLQWFRYLRAIKNDHLAVLFIGLFWSVTGFLICSQFTVASRYISSILFFWLVLGIAHVIFRHLSSNRQAVIDRIWQNPVKRSLWMKYPVMALAVFVFAGISNGTVKRYVSDVTLQNAYMNAKAGKFLLAKKGVDEAIRLWPKSVDAYYQRGYVEFYLGAYDDAIRDYHQVRKWAPNYTNVNFNLASCHYRKHDWVSAIRALEDSEALHPEYQPGLSMLANCYYYVRQPRKAQMYCAKILALDPKNEKMLALRDRLTEILSSS